MRYLFTSASSIMGSHVRPKGKHIRPASDFHKIGTACEYRASKQLGTWRTVKGQHDFHTKRSSASRMVVVSHFAIMKQLAEQDRNAGVIASGAASSSTSCPGDGKFVDLAQ